MNNRRFAVIWSVVWIFGMGFVFLGAAGGQTRTQAKPQAKTPQITRIDLNKATAEQLGKCPGVSPTLAKAMVEHREKSGSFKTSEDLLKVRGMTKEILGKLNLKMERDILYVTPAAPSSEEDEEEPSLKPSKC